MVGALITIRGWFVTLCEIGGSSCWIGIGMAWVLYGKDLSAGDIELASTTTGGESGGDIGVGGNAWSG